MGMGKAFVGLGLVAAIAVGGFVVGGFHTIDLGEYHVVKSFNGNTKIIDEPGWYVNYGTETVYPKFVSLDFSGSEDALASLVIPPMGVKYAEGGTGTIEGNVQIEMPNDFDNRMKVHNKFGSKDAFMRQLIRNATGEALTFTAGLMESQEAYMTHRAQFRTAAKDQLLKGLYSTTMKESKRKDSKGEDVVSIKAIPMVSEEGKFVRQDASPLAQYGVTLTQFNVQDWNFEAKTMERIAEKRDAENKVITSRARTEAAEQAKKEAEANAARDKAVTEGKAEADAAVLVVNAERDKKLAEIAAAQRVTVAAELKAQRAEELAAAKLEAQSIEVLSIANAEAADRMINSGGQLSAEQQTQIKINEAWANAYARKAVPQYNVGDAAMGDSSMDATQSAMTTLQLKAATEMLTK